MGSKEFERRLVYNAVVTIELSKNLDTDHE